TGVNKQPGKLIIIKNIYTCHRDAAHPYQLGADTDIITCIYIFYLKAAARINIQSRISVIRKNSTNQGDIPRTYNFDTRSIVSVGMHIFKVNIATGINKQPGIKVV